MVMDAVTARQRARGALPWSPSTLTAQRAVVAEGVDALARDLDARGGELEVRGVGVLGPPDPELDDGAGGAEEQLGHVARGGAEHVLVPHLHQHVLGEEASFSAAPWTDCVDVEAVVRAERQDHADARPICRVPSTRHRAAAAFEFELPTLSAIPIEGARPSVVEAGTAFWGLHRSENHSILAFRVT
eukprot:CAMPEP_0181317148 /NCGR_PEP_ID=MMETSP1101-20121128/16288_1 /TAXON_ID=46948 /ORGANISM="Rhodomonas abbreviata, Strain Caron Lab Isolate" /LENGTH=186 /DNA_ID=CAMNT_0023424471 /DNA_START=289 /DNA_END=847 /DNA_ORIENTATION=-